MAQLPNNTKTTKFVVEVAPEHIIWPGRDYLGMSGIAGSCDTQIWLSWRWASEQKITPRLKRIFNRGDIEEERVISELKDHGMKIFRLEGEKEIELTGKIGEAQEELVDLTGHSKGHPDGRILGVIEAPKKVHLLEIKTMAEKYYKIFVAKGIKESNPRYYGQMQIYMLEMGLDRALIVVTNKNTEERGYERVHFDKSYAEDLKSKRQDLIFREIPPSKIFPKTWWKCKSCAHRPICHEDSAPIKSCRTCEHVALGVGGVWMCGLNNDKELNRNDQITMKPCSGESYKRLF